MPALLKPPAVSMNRSMRKVLRDLAELSSSKVTPQKYPIEHPTRFNCKERNSHRKKFSADSLILKPQKVTKVKIHG